MSYQFCKEDLFDFAKTIGAETKTKGDELFFKRCPYCNGGKSDYWTFSVNMISGAFKCFRASCLHDGHFVELCRDMDYLLKTEKPKNYRKLQQRPIKTRDAAVEYMKTRGISETITRRYNITVKKNDKNIIVFPFYDETNKLTCVKYRRANFDKNRDKNKEWFEKDTEPILFGMNHCHGFDRLIITEGQIDSLSVAEAGISNAVSVPTGATGFTWLENVWSWIIQFKEIIVFGDYEKGEMTLLDQLIARLPNEIAIKAVRLQDYLGEKDANDILRKYGAGEIKKCIENAEIPDYAIKLVIKKQLAKKKVAHRNGESEEIPLQTAENYLTVFQKDPYFRSVRYNVMKAVPERVEAGKRTQWEDADDADARVYIERKYGLSNREKANDAFSVFLRSRRYHPVQELIKAIEPDGKKRCEQFLIRWMGADDTAYNQEVSRLLFAGGIWRTFSPGCKFDCVPVLIGKQGGGKSTIIQWLAMDADFYASLKTISGQKGLEGILGKFVVEIEELLAVLANDRAGTKQEESAKAFLSGMSDFYRKSYDRRPTDQPRSNIFVGSTNRDEFLTDKTGNRRWFPVRCNSNGNRIYQQKDAIQEDIRQCWAEMYAAFVAGDPFAQPTPRIEMLADIKKQQTDAEVDDYRVGMIREFLEGKDRVCLIQIWKECLHPSVMNVPECTPKTSRELADILTHQLGWLRGGTLRFGKEYGRQKAFLPPEPVKLDGFEEIESTEDDPF